MLVCAKVGRLPRALTFDIGLVVTKTALAYLVSGYEYALDHTIAVFRAKLSTQIPVPRGTLRLSENSLEE